MHRFADFEDLSYLDFILSAAAIGPALAKLHNAPLGETILEAVRATRQVVQTNTNLGMVLLLAPVSKVDVGDGTASLEALLAAASVADAILVFEAIRLAQPGGLGKVSNQDIANEPTATLLEAMALAAERDVIARQYVNGFRDVFDGLQVLMEGWRHFGSVEAAILELQLDFLKRLPDSLIVRKHGLAVAEEVSRRAREIDLSPVRRLRGLQGI